MGLRNIRLNYHQIDTGHIVRNCPLPGDSNRLQERPGLYQTNNPALGFDYVHVLPSIPMPHNLQIVILLTGKSLMLIL